MSSQSIVYRDYSLSDELLPEDLSDEPDDDVRWLHYCEVAATVNRQHIIECVLSDLDSDDSPLYDFIDDAIANPHEPGRAKANLVELAKLGQAVLNLIAKSDERIQHGVTRGTVR
jgi:hypothetical protein